MEPVKDYQGMKIIGIDNGYGNIKTANCCFPAGLTVHDAEPVFKDDLLVYDGRYYLIGTGHKEFKADKTGDDDYYILTLAAIARELNVYGLTDATVYLAVGLPLTWVSRQREDFKAYLMRNRELAFTFRGKAYRVEIAGVDVFPQGFAAVAGQIRDFQGVNMLCDIGNGTMNIMFINDRKPVVDRMFTEKYGTHQCMLAVRENVMRTHHATVDESIINRVLRFGTADIREDYLTTIRETAAEYVGEIFRTYILAERGDEICIIDKHAAHERQLFEKLAAHYGDVPSQLLLEPLVVELSAEEKTALLTNLDLLESAGLEVSDFGGSSVCLRSVPADVEQSSAEDLLVELAAKLAHGSRDALNERTEWVLHSISCRAAIKAGDHTSPQELMALAEKILSGEVPPFCPHGRPCVLKLTRKELEKQFGRIV